MLFPAMGKNIQYDHPKKCLFNLVILCFFRFKLRIWNRFLAIGIENPIFFLPISYKRNLKKTYPIYKWAYSDEWFAHSVFYGLSNKLLTLYGPNSFFRRFSGHNLRQTLSVYRLIGATLIGNFCWWSLLKIELKFSERGHQCPPGR